jgi:hypothetical protein
MLDGMNLQRTQAGTYTNHYLAEEPTNLQDARQEKIADPLSAPHLNQIDILDLTTVQNSASAYFTSLIPSLYRNKTCGICRETETRVVVWYSPVSLFAHKECASLIDEAEKDFLTTINALYPGPTSLIRDLAAFNGRGAVQLACESLTVKAFVEKYGIGMLTHIYNTLGIAGAKNFTLRLPIQSRL